MVRAANLKNLKPLSIFEIAKRGNSTFEGKAPDLFEQWWRMNRKELASATNKSIAKAAWYACAESLGVFEDREQG